MQFGASSPGAVASFNADQVKHVKPAAFGTLNALQVRAFEGPALKAISNHQWNALPAGAFSAGQLRALPTGTLDKFKPANFGAMPALVFGGYESRADKCDGRKAFSTSGPAQVAAFKPGALTAVSGQQLKTMPAKAMIGLETKQIKAITTAALNGGMNRTKVNRIAGHRCSHDNEATQTGDDQV